jgi:hypothetical protein
MEIGEFRSIFFIILQKQLKIKKDQNVVWYFLIFQHDGWMGIGGSEALDDCSRPSFSGVAWGLAFSTPGESREQRLPPGKVKA